MWTFYNDTRLVQRQYPHLRAHTAFLIAEAAGVRRFHEQGRAACSLVQEAHVVAVSRVVVRGRPAMMGCSTLVTVRSADSSRCRVGSACDNEPSRCVRMLCRSLTAGGDWCPPSIPQECYTPSALVSTFMYLRQLRMVADMGELVGDTATAAQFSQLAANVSAAFQRHFYDGTTKTYRDPGTTLSLQTATSLALVLGLVPEADKPAVVQSLVHDVMVTHSGHIATGMVGTKCVRDQRVLPVHACWTLTATVASGAGFCL